MNVRRQSVSVFLRREIGLQLVHVPEPNENNVRQRFGQLLVPASLFEIFADWCPFRVRQSSAAERIVHQRVLHCPIVFLQKSPQKTLITVDLPIGVPQLVIREQVVIRKSCVLLQSRAKVTLSYLVTDKSDSKLALCQWNLAEFVSQARGISIYQKPLGLSPLLRFAQIAQWDLHFVQVKLSELSLMVDLQVIAL